MVLGVDPGVSASVGVLLDAPAIRVWAHRILETAEASSNALEPWTGFWNILGMFALFVLFYMTALSIAYPLRFYALFIAVHVCDLLWFGVLTAFSDRLGQELKKPMRRFILLDFATIGLLLMVVLFGKDYVALLGLIVMVTLAALDLRWNSNFFFPKSATTPPSGT